MATGTHRVYIRLRERQPHPARRLTRHDSARAAGARHTTAPSARVRRGGAARRARAGMAVSAVGVRECGYRRGNAKDRDLWSIEWFSGVVETDTARHAKHTLATIASRTFDSATDTVPRGGLTIRCAHGATQRFMPGMRLERRGDIRHCQWHVLADLGGVRQRRSGAWTRHESLRAEWRWPDRLGDRILGVNV